MKPEFVIGQLVTFRPYEKSCAGKVIGIMRGMWGNGKYPDGSVDSRIFYRISGKDVFSTTTGRSIVESSLYTE